MPGPRDLDDTGAALGATLSSDAQDTHDSRFAQFTVPDPRGSDRAATDETVDSEETIIGGRTFGRFVVERELGHGGMGRVHEAHDPELGRLVAIKVAHRHLEGDSLRSARFNAEARVTAQLEHPNIVPVYD